MKDIKELSNSILNQAKFIQDETKDIVANPCKILDFQKELIRKNPMNSMQYTWQMAQMRKTWVFWVTLPFVISQTFWDTWQQVYRPELSTKKEKY